MFNFLPLKLDIFVSLQKIRLMARKKKINEKDIYSFYMDYYLKNGEAPKSVYQLSKEYNFEETHFYQFFGNLSGIEKSIFKSFFEQTLALLNKSEEYLTFDSRNKLLSFYYTFFEILTANRSFVLTVLERDKNSPRFLKTVSYVKPEFSKFLESLDIEKIDFKGARIEKMVEKSLDESFWIQMVICIKFWMDDDSASLEKTDIFIEKSINTGFDLINVQPIQSVIDLGKFLFHEKMNMN